MNLQPIRIHANFYHGGLKKLAADAGMSEANLHRCIRNNKIQASDLEALSRLLNVEIGIFFSESPSAKEQAKNSLHGYVPMVAREN